MKIFTFFICIFFILAHMALADCFHNGKAYTTGDEVGDYICSATGQWIRK